MEKNSSEDKGQQQKLGWLNLAWMNSPLPAAEDLGYPAAQWLVLQHSNTVLFEDQSGTVSSGAVHTQ